MAPGEDANSGVSFLSDSKHEDAISCLESTYKLIPLFASSSGAIKRCGFHINGTPKMSQIGPLIYGITHFLSNFQDWNLFILNWASPRGRGGGGYSPNKEDGGVPLQWVTFSIYSQEKVWQKVLCNGAQDSRIVSYFNCCRVLNEISFVFGL